MAKFEIKARVVETYDRTFLVEADTEEEALEMMRSYDFDNSSYLPDDDESIEWVARDPEVVGVAGNGGPGL